MQHFLDLKNRMSALTNCLCRVWIFDHEPIQIEVWEHQLAPTVVGHRSGAEWCLEHLNSCYTEKDLREMLGVPEEGNFQVLFKAKLEGMMSGHEEMEWDESLDPTEIQIEPIHDDYLGLMSNHPLVP